MSSSYDCGGTVTDSVAIMLAVEIDTSEIPSIFDRICSTIGERYWLRRIRSLNEELRGKPFLRDFFVEENGIAFALAKCSDFVQRYGQIPLRCAEDRSIYPAISLAAQVLSIADRSTPAQAKAICGRVRGALKNPDDMRAMRLELMVATHFAHRGHAVAWPELEGLGTFDLLVKDLGDTGLEVECKAISCDKGRKIHRRDAIEFLQLVHEDAQKKRQSLRSGLSVVVTVPERLPTSHSGRRELAKHVAAAMRTEQSTRLEDGTEIGITGFDIELLGDVDSSGRPIDWRQAVDRVTGTANRECMLLGIKHGGTVAIALQSLADDTLLRYIVDTASRSAKKQLTKTRGALFMIGLDGLGGADLVNLAQSEAEGNRAPTAIQVAASEFLSSQERDHVVGIGFLSRSALSVKSDGIVASGGSAYVFSKHESRFWHDDFSGLFSERTGS